MDPERGLCFGCGRTLDEIAGWAGLSEAQREAILDELPSRLRPIAAPAPGSS